MRLNPDCIRDILLTVEENTDINSSFVYFNDKFPCNEQHNDCELLSKYDTEEVLYHIRQCELSDLIVATKWYKDDSCKIKDLSPQGHNFLANIRSDNIWNNTKKVATKVGSISLDALIKISTSVLTQIINKQLEY